MRLVAELGTAPRHVLRELLADAAVQRRLLVLLQRLAPDLARPCGRVFTAVALPALVVLRRREQRAVEALAEPLERVRRAEEMAAVADLLVRRVRERLLGHLERRELRVQHAQDLDVD